MTQLIQQKSNLECVTSRHNSDLQNAKQAQKQQDKRMNQKTFEKQRSSQSPSNKNECSQEQPQMNHAEEQKYVDHQQSFNRYNGKEDKFRLSLAKQPQINSNQQQIHKSGKGNKTELLSKTESGLTKIFDKIEQMLVFLEQDKYVQDYYATIGIKKVQIQDSLEKVKKCFQDFNLMMKEHKVSQHIARGLIDKVVKYLQEIEYNPKKKTAQESSASPLLNVKLSEEEPSGLQCNEANRSNINGNLSSNTNTKIKNIALSVLQFQTKFSVCIQFFQSISLQQNNIATSQHSQNQFKQTWDKIKFQKPVKFYEGQQSSFSSNADYSKKISNKYALLKKMLTITTSAVLVEEQVDCSLLKKICFGLSYPRYFVDYNQARLASFLFLRSPSIQMAKKIWNIPEKGAMRQVIKVAFQSIAVNEKIYIPISTKRAKEGELGADPQGSNRTSHNIHEYSSNCIQVRLLNHQALKFKKFPSKNKKSCLRSMMCCNCDEQQQLQQYGSQGQQIQSIIIHMHGGGFIALSSRMMQTMTRRWANSLKVPIFSIDYRKPPQYPFPSAVEDCLTVYKFIVKEIRNYFNINPKHIFLAGDSAGGNLACSLMGNILKQRAQVIQKKGRTQNLGKAEHYDKELQQLPIPSGLYLAYPALDLRVRFSPSRINAVTDPLLWPSMLLLCLNEYLKGNKEHQLDPLASPILFTEEYIGNKKGDKRFPTQWPATYITVGQRDPLYDDSIILMQKLTESKIENCKCRVYPQFSHGFLSTDFLISQCDQAIKDSITDLKMLIWGSNRKIVHGNKEFSLKSKNQQFPPKIIETTMVGVKNKQH